MLCLCNIMLFHSINIWPAGRLSLFLSIDSDILMNCHFIILALGYSSHCFADKHCKKNVFIFNVVGRMEEGSIIVEDGIYIYILTYRYE